MYRHFIVKSAIFLLTIGGWCDVRGILGVNSKNLSYWKALKIVRYIFCIKYISNCEPFDQLFNYLHALHV